MSQITSWPLQLPNGSLVLKVLWGQGAVDGLLAMIRSMSRYMVNSGVNLIVDQPN